MKTNQIIFHPANRNQFSQIEFEDAFYHSQLQFSLRHLIFTGDISTENIMEALQKALQICYLAGINSKHHFKQIYVFDAKTGTLNVDWYMSKKGFNLMVMQIPLLNEKLSSWLWKLADS